MNETATKYLDYIENIQRAETDILNQQARIRDWEHQRARLEAELMKSLPTETSEKHYKTKNGKIVRVNKEGIKVLEVE